ncbi:DUF7147 family protein [Aquibacillus rhizosphaerae]|uniref:Methylthioribose kinase n=1 Tax=Aquibacillus rhizosphaerae TaxID=3051431 RepID=A0ABT7L607_9BACI|nr:methylthioribose kinase [Aquibacillus sp. LR5S19]MDL4841284.1 methylthioribose kinase [Aquibacillus sp. LR5S19]
MVQRFIELGEGYSDLYELIELAKSMPERVENFIIIKTAKRDETLASLALVMKPTEEGNFQQIYICLEGIPLEDSKQSKRYQLFEQLALSFNKEVKSITVKPSSFFHEKTLYYQYLLGIFQMNRLIRSNF